MKDRYLVDGIVYVVKLLVGRADWEKVHGTVDSLTGSTLDGDEKRRLAVDTLRSMGVTAASFLLNLAIEAAVAWAKTRDGNLP